MTLLQFKKKIQTESFEKEEGRQELSVETQQNQISIHNLFFCLSCG